MDLKKRHTIMTKKDMRQALLTRKRKMTMIIFRLRRDYRRQASRTVDPTAPSSKVISHKKAHRITRKEENLAVKKQHCKPFAVKESSSFNPSSCSHHHFSGSSICTRSMDCFRHWSPSTRQGSFFPALHLPSS